MCWRAVAARRSSSVSARAELSQETTAVNAESPNLLLKVCDLRGWRDYLAIYSSRSRVDYLWTSQLSFHQFFSVLPFLHGLPAQPPYPLDSASPAGEGWDVQQADA